MLRTCLVMVVLLCCANICHADVNQIEAKIQSFVEAFNKADVDSILAHCSAEIDWTLPDGTKRHGHAEIRKMLSTYFETSKGARLELAETKIEMLSPSVGLEKGVSRVIQADEEPSTSSYSVIHIKTADGWKMDRITEMETATKPPSHYNQLKGLEWLVGTWSVTNENVHFENQVRWTTNQNFLMRSFRVETTDQEPLEGTQIIGWDPARNTIRSWLFDSDGGFGVAKWKQQDHQWIVSSLQTLPDGRQASATQVYEIVDEQTVKFSSIGRQVDGELLPSVGPVTLQRAE